MTYSGSLQLKYGKPVQDQLKLWLVLLAAQRRHRLLLHRDIGTTAEGGCGAPQLSEAQCTASNSPVPASDTIKQNLQSAVKQHNIADCKVLLDSGNGGSWRFCSYMFQHGVCFIPTAINTAERVRSGIAQRRLHLCCLHSYDICSTHVTNTCPW